MFEWWARRRPAWPALIAGAAMAMCAVGIVVDGFDHLSAPQAPRTPAMSESEVDRTIATHVRRIKRVLGGGYTREPTIGPMVCPGRVISLDRRAGRAAQFSLAIAREDRPAVVTRLRDELRTDGWTAEYPLDGPSGRLEVLEARNSEGYRVRVDAARQDGLAVRVESPC